MSRIGRKPVSIPQGVKVNLDGAVIRAEGPKGKLSQPVPAGISAKIENNQLVISRSGEDRKVRALHGLARALVANMVTGVKDGFERKLEIVGIGYRAQLQGGRVIQLALGYSHPVIFPLPEGVTAEIDRQVSITLRGADKAVLGQTAAKLRALRKPDPYKGKGIRYQNEVVRRKVGKKAGAGAK
jgi:large subunit ribosomal protein L6